MNTLFDNNKKVLETYKKRFIIAFLAYFSSLTLPLFLYLIYLNFRVLYLWFFILIVFFIIKRATLSQLTYFSFISQSKVLKMLLALTLVISVTTFSLYELSEKSEINSITSVEPSPTPSSESIPQSDGTSADGISNDVYNTENNQTQAQNIPTQNRYPSIINEAIWVDELPLSLERNFLTSVKVFFVQNNEYEIYFPEVPLANIILRIQLFSVDGTVYEEYVYKLKSNTWRFLDTGFIESSSQTVGLLLHIQSEGLAGQELESGKVISDKSPLIVKMHYSVSNVQELSSFP